MIMGILRIHHRRKVDKKNLDVWSCDTGGAAAMWTLGSKGHVNLAD